MKYVVNMGETVTFSCVATGAPPPTIKWLRNDIELSDIDSRVNLTAAVTVYNSSRYIYEVTRTLILQSNQDEHSGLYECEATNNAVPGVDIQLFELIVQSK